MDDLLLSPKQIESRKNHLNWLISDQKRFCNRILGLGASAAIPSLYLVYHLQREKGGKFDIYPGRAGRPKVLIVCYAAASVFSTWQWSASFDGIEYTQYCFMAFFSADWVVVTGLNGRVLSLLFFFTYLFGYRYISYGGILFNG